MAKYNIKRRHSKTLDLSLQKRNKPTVGNIFDGEHNFGATIQPINNFVSNFGDIRKLTPKQAKQVGITPTSTLTTPSLPSSGSGFDFSNFMGKAGNVVSGVTSIIDSSLKNAQIADTTGIESDIKDLRDTDFSEATNSDSLIDAYNNLNFLKDDYSWRDVRGVSNGELVGNTLSAVGSGAMAGASVGGPYGAIAGAAIGLGGSLAGIFTGKNKARKKARFLNQAAEAANDMAIDNYDFQVNDVMQNNARNAMQYAYAAEGGPINIKKKNRGKFTESASRAGMGVQEYARHILANKDKYSSTLVKRANFARNAAGWKHALGGYIKDRDNMYDNLLESQTHGGDFSNGVTFINNGGTHEQNPFEGVPMGVAPDGQPNLVEEGEVLYKDYVFSNRLHPTDKELKESNLPKKYKGHTFALIAEDMSKESAERPNDPISKRGLEASLGKLASIQEEQRMKKGKTGTQQMMAFGGRKYDGVQNLPPAIVTDTRRQMPSLIDLAAYANFIERMQNSNNRKFKETLPAIPRIDNTISDNAVVNNPVGIAQRKISNTPSYVSPYDELSDDLTPTATSPSLKTSTQKNGKAAKKQLDTFARYAPAVGSALGAVQSVFQKPDYTNSDLILDVVNNLSRNKVSPTLLGNYLRYNPIDRNYYLNQLQGQAGATRRAVMNSGLNSGQRIAGLLAADYNAQQGIADTLLKADMYNEQLRQNIAQFNRGTDQYNSGALMQAAAQNAQLAQARDNMRLSGTATAANMRELADTALATSRSANLTNFFDNLGSIGRENRDANMLQAMIDSDLFGTLSESMKRGWNKNGGMLTKRSRRRK